MPNKSNIFVDISDSEWKVVQFHRDKGKVLLKRCDVIAFSGRGPQDIERDFKSASVPVKQSDVVVSLPRKKVMIKHMRLPSSDSGEIAKMISLQLVSQIPYSPQDVVYDHVILRTDETGYTHVQVIVVLLSVIDEYLKFIKPLAASIRQMSVSSYGICAWFHMLAQKRSWPSQKVFMVLNINQEYSEVCFCQGAQLLFSRFIPSGFSDLSQKETAAFLQQLQWSLDLYQKEHVGSQLNHALIVSSADLKFLKEMLEDKLKMAVDTAHPFDILGDKDRKTFELMAPKDGRSWTVCLGHVLNPSVQNLNLSPGALRKSYASKKQSRQRVIAAWLTAAAVALGIGFVVMETSARNTRLSAVEALVNDLQPKADHLKMIKDHAAALDEYFQKRILVSDLMKELYKRTPEDVIYQSVYWTEEGEWILEGYAQTRSGVNNLQSGLIDSSWFQDVQLDYATKRKLGNADVTDFKIHCRVADKTRESK